MKPQTKTEVEVVEVDVQDQLFDEEFIGGWEPLSEFDCPPIQQIPPAGIDIIERRLHIDMRDNTVPVMIKLAATEWFFRNRAGQRVTLRQVMRGGTMFEVMTRKEAAAAGDEAQEDPTPPGAATG